MIKNPSLCAPLDRGLDAKLAEPLSPVLRLPVHKAFLTHLHDQLQWQLLQRCLQNVSQCGGESLLQLLLVLRHLALQQQQQRTMQQAVQ